MTAKSIEDIAQYLETDLGEGRKRGTVTPERPIKASAIRRVWDGKRDRPHDVESRTIREAVRMNVENGIPIGSSNRGYYMCQNEVELANAIKYVQDMAVEIMGHATALKKCAKRPNVLLDKRQQELFDLLKKTFDAVEIN